jgi:ParB family chromosome partitioning protein
VADKILNTGLDALLGDVATPNKQSIKEIELNQIKPNRFQPRQTFDEQKITELSQSIATHGILSPILVRETGAGGYELIAGERRLRAAKKAGLKPPHVWLTQLRISFH